VGKGCKSAAPAARGAMRLGSIANISVIASEAKQSSKRCRNEGLDCFVASLLAMTIQPNFIPL
jgi:hypothetical protein